MTFRPGLPVGRPGRNRSHFREQRRWRLAVLVVGVRERFILEPTLRHVVLPAVRAGYQVDYFLQLARDWNGAWCFPEVPQAMASPYTNMSKDALEALVLKQAVLHVAHHVSIRLKDESDKIEILKPWHIHGERFSAYPPGFTKSGKNQLRRLKAMEELWNHTVAYAGSRTAYRLVLDKVIIVGGRVAYQVMNMYDQFYHNRDRALDKCHTVEDLYTRVTMFQKMRVQILRFSVVPFYVAKYIRLPDVGPTLCLRYALTVPCEMLHERYRGRRRCWFDPSRAQCMGEHELRFPGCGNFCTRNCDLRLDYR